MALHAKVKQLINKEYQRQQHDLTLIPSENYVSAAVQQAQSSCFTNKYSEGYPGKRYYGGNTYTDELELLCQTQAQKVFATDYAVNVQPYSGSPANIAAYLALIDPGDTIMGLDLPAGGHLTHGFKVSATGRIFRSISYNVDPATGALNYDAIEKLAVEHKPRILIAGTTAYARTLDFARFAAIAQRINAYLVADISHISGLVATGLHPSPFGHADIVTTTTHKMLRGPRGALIFSRDDETATKVNKSVFPGLQGGPHMHTIAAITQALFEAGSPNYTTYCRRIIDNAQAMVQTLQSRGFDIVTGGTDNHLWLVDLRNKNLTGAAAQELLEKASVVVNKNTIPYDPASAFKPSGIRMGTPALTTRGFKTNDSRHLAEIVADILDGKSADTATLAKIIGAHPMPTAAMIDGSLY